MSEKRIEFYISPAGDDRWSGRLAEPNAERTDGPFATIVKARDTIRQLKLTGRLDGPVIVWLRGGRYAITEPLTFESDDSAPVTYTAYTGERVVIDGGRRISQWQIERLNSKDVWVVEIPEVAQGKWYFRQLFVNGQRRQRARLPKQGFYWIKDVPGMDIASVQLFDGSDTFTCAPGDIQHWRNLTDVEVVVLHYWIEERMPIQSFDEATGIVKSSRRSMFAIRDDVASRYAKYYVDNVFEALSEPGEWYLDRHSGKLYYIPMPGETPDNTEVFAPYVNQFLKLVGQPGEGRYVEFLRFVDLEFCHADWYQPTGGGERFGRPGIDFAAAPQAAFNVPGTIYMEGARYCAIEDCKIEHIGWYGVELSEGCKGNRIVGNDIYDMGAGGIKLNGSDVKGPTNLRTGDNVITDNHIHAGGRVFHSAVGILSVHSFGNTISHNHIYDLYYTGISCGWIWGYADSVSMNNRIEKNHIHDLGHGLLSDMGGIYTLGVQPGTVIRGNVIHDIEKCNYGGWAIYPDEGSSHILIENNICYNTSSQCFHQHYGRENIVRNNIFAFGREGVIAHGRAEEHKAFTLERNIVITDGRPLFVGGYAGQLEKRNFFSDLNLFWDIFGGSLISGNEHRDKQGQWGLARTFDMDEWRQMGYDRHSIVADPLFKDLKNHDFTLTDNSPALGLGFQPIDISDVGPRPKGQRIE